MICLAAYSFHFDLSKGFLFKACLLPYAIAFNDLHNFYLSVDDYKKFFRAEWLTKKVPLKSFNVSVPYTGLLNGSMNQEAINRHTDTWKGKYYPETRDENIKILDDYLTLCEENNIRPIMFNPPKTEKYMKSFNPKLLEEFYVLIEQACKKHPSAVFIDGWKLKGLTYDDFFDHSHLNRYGAAKFSAYLNDFIEELDFNYYRDVNNFHNRFNDSIGELDFYNHL